MRRGIVLKSLAAAVGIYTAAGFLGVPYIIKNIVPEKISEATKGGKFAVGKVRFNPYNFHLTLRDLSFKTPQNGELAALDSFSLNIDPLDYLWKGGWVVKDISFIGPKITLTRDKNGEFNFKWLTELGSDEPKDESSEPLKLLIRHFSLKNGSLDYSDYADGKSYQLGLGPIGFNLDNIDLRDMSKADGQMRLYATINDGGFVDLRGKIDALSPLKAGGNIAFDSGKLYTPWRYFKEKFPIEVADGKARFSFDYRFNGDDINGTELSKLNFDISKLRIIPKGEQYNLLSMEGLHLREGSVLPMRKVFNAEALEISGVNVAASRGTDGKIDWLNYIDEIQKAFPEDENETKEPWNFRINTFALQSLGVQWTDNAPLEPYRFTLSNARLHTGSIQSDEKVPLDITAATDAVSLIRQSDNAVVASVEGIGVEGVRIDRAGRFASVDKFFLTAPSVKTKRLKDGTIDLSRFAYASAADPKTSASSAPAWGFRLGEFDVNQGSVGFVDEVPAKNVLFDLDQLNLKILDIDGNPAIKSRYDVSSRLNATTALAATGDFIRASTRSNGAFTVKGLDISTFDPYLEPSTYASLKRGSVSIGGNYDYSPPKATVKGKVALSDWVVNDSRDDSVLLGWQTIGATPFAYAYPDNRLKINQLAVDGLYTNALIDANKVLNYSMLSKSKPAATNASKTTGGNPFGIDIVKLLVRDSSATFSDLSLPLPFKTYIHDMEGSVLGISTTKDGVTFVKLRGGVDQYGLAKIDGSLNTKAPKQFTDIKVAFDNLDLKNYTPYSLQFLGYKIDGGKLFLNLGYNIDSGKLHADNKVVIKQIELGAEKEGGSPWPMRLVVALLEDTEGVIDIDLPVEGDVNNPDFKYGKVVWQVIGNLLTKAVTSPFRLLASMMGIESDKLSSIDFDGGSVVLSPPQIEKLDHITTMLLKRPKLSLEVYGAWEEAGDSYVLKGRKLVAEALKRSKEQKPDSPQAISLDLLEDMADDMIGKKERKELKARMEEQYAEEAAFVRHYSMALIERLIEKQSVTPEELQALAAKRAEMIRSYLLKTPGLEKRIIVKLPESVKPLESHEIPVRLEVVVQK